MRQFKPRVLQTCSNFVMLSLAWNVVKQICNANLGGLFVFQPLFHYCSNLWLPSSYVFPSKLNSLSLVLLFSLLYKVVERRGFLPMSNHLFSSLTNNPRCGTQDFWFQFTIRSTYLNSESNLKGKTFLNLKAKIYFLFQ